MGNYDRIQDFFKDPEVLNAMNLFWKLFCKVLRESVELIKESFDPKTYRKEEIKHKLENMGISPLDVMITGVTGAGKSTTLNSLLKEPAAKVGDGADPETMEIDSYLLNDCFRLWDTPGLGDGVKQDEIHSKKIRELLNKTYIKNNAEYGFIDLVIVIIEGSNRDMGTTNRLLNEVIIPNIQSDRILVAVNKADMGMKGRHWDNTINLPDNVLTEYLESQSESIQKRVKESTGKSIKKPVYYSAETGYHVKNFLDFIIDNIPDNRRNLNV